MDYQTVIVGAGVIGLLEAAHEVACGRTALIIEKSDQIGGAWATTNISDWRGVEKGVHYLSPDPKAKAFLSEFLGLHLDSMRPKYLVTSGDAGLCEVMDFRSLRSRLTYPRVYWRRAKYKNSAKSWKDHLSYWLRLPVRSLSDSSWYFAQGSSSLTSRALSLCQSLDVPIVFGQEVTEIDVVESGVYVRARDRSFLASRALVPHGVSNLQYRFGSSNESPARSPNMKSPRPQLVLVFSSLHMERLAEYIFVNDSIVKYAHEVSGYAQPRSPRVLESQRILAIALQPHLACTDDTPEFVFRHLKALGIIDSGAELLETRLSMEHIPQVDYALATQLERAAGGRLTFMLTENMAAALGENSARWMASLGPVLR